MLSIVFTSGEEFKRGGRLALTSSYSFITQPCAKCQPCAKIRSWGVQLEMSNRRLEGSAWSWGRSSPEMWVMECFHEPIAEARKVGAFRQGAQERFL